MHVLEFTAEQINTIRELKRREFADATQDEIELYAQWTAAQATDADEHAAAIEAMREQALAETARREDLANTAKAVLDAKLEVARTRLAMLKGGE